MTLNYRFQPIVQAKEGEKVKFRLENLNGTYIITTLEER